MWSELHRLFALVPRDGDVRAVVLYSEGKCFTAGLDCAYPLRDSLTQCATRR